MHWSLAHHARHSHTNTLTTQLYMLRTMLESICADDKKKSVKHELDSKYYPAMLEFYKESYYFSYLLNFNGASWDGARLFWS